MHLCNLLGEVCSRDRRVLRWTLQTPNQHAHGDQITGHLVAASTATDSDRDSDIDSDSDSDSDSGSDSDSDSDSGSDSDRARRE